MSGLFVTLICTGPCGLSMFLSADIKEEMNGFLGTDVPRFTRLGLFHCSSQVCFLHIEGETLHQQKEYNSLALLGPLLHCGALEPNLQYLRGLPV